MGDHVGIQQSVLLAARGFSVFPFVCPIAILEATASAHNSSPPWEKQVFSQGLYFKYTTIFVGPWAQNTNLP